MLIILVSLTLESFKYPFSLLSFGDDKMAELKVKIPKLLEGDADKLEKDVEDLIASEEKRKLLSLFIGGVMKGAKQLSKEELVELGRSVKKGRFEKLKQMGLV